MEVPEDILELLKCSECDGLLSRGPVYLHPDGGGLCSVCHAADPTQPATRSTHYEAVAGLLRFPCRRQPDGCQEKLPFNDPAGHETVCPFREYVCPVLGAPACDWAGVEAGFLDHCREKHPHNVLSSPAALTHDITSSSSNTYLLQAFQLLFLLLTKVCVKSGKLYYCVRYLGNCQAENYTYTLHITRNGEIVTKKGQVAPQGCMTMQEDSSLIININGLLQMLGGYNDTIFTITMQQTHPEKNARKQFDTCYKCDLLIRVKDNRDAEGWICLYCIPKIKCNFHQSYTTCSYQTFPEKLEKHKKFFCQQRSYSFGSFDLLTSYRFDQISNKSGRFKSIIENTTFDYLWTKSCIEFRIYASQENLILSQYKCTIKVIQVDTGHNCTYTPDFSYENEHDWYAKISKEDFPVWSDIFDISVDISKKEDTTVSSS